MNGKHAVDPRGWHGTFAFIFNGQHYEGFHVASHEYTPGKEYFIPGRPHSYRRGPTGRRRVKGERSRKVVCANDSDLEEYKDSPISYSHLSG